MPDLAPSRRTQAKRLHERARYDHEAIRAILDAGLICHVGYVFEGHPVVTPTIYWREDDILYWHGSSASRMLRAVENAEVCVTVSHLDGLVLARSAFHHSANYRSVMLFGRARLVESSAEKLDRLKGLIESLYPGRWDMLRPTSDLELKATRVMWIPIEEASAKVRTGGPNDDAEDMDATVWAGTVPLQIGAGAPEPDYLTTVALPQTPAITKRLLTRG
ncbi:MAG TPA: pyridoxamine 5'-phosphate oxidase family protein [Alphaproteobacteria bacterium]|nr:pyridoxamine 5'-phosphate oxidase family protein [Alphaproteobacteria bacterium]